MSNKNYFHEIPIVRSIACLLVVMVHVTAVNYSSKSGFFDSFSLYLNQFSRLGTPVFAVISGFLLFNSVKNKGFFFKKFIYSRTTKIVLPFIIWSSVYLGLKIYAGQSINTEWRSFLDYFILGTSYYHLYFIITVIQFYLLFPLLQLSRKKWSISLLFLISIPLNYIWLNKMYTSINFGQLQYIIKHRSFILNSISFFMFGAVLAYDFDSIMKFCKKYYMLLVGVFVFCLILIYHEIKPSVLLNSSRIENLFYIPIFVLFLLGMSRFILKVPLLGNVMTLIGNYSMGIYLVHPLVIFFARDYIPSTFWEPQLLIVTFSIVVVFSITLVKLISYLPKSNYIITIPTKK